MRNVSNGNGKLLILLVLAALAAFLYNPSPGLAVPILGPDLATFAVLGSTGVTNVPSSTIGGNLGSSPNGSIGGGYTFTYGGPQSNTATAIAAQGQLTTARTNLGLLGPGTTLAADLTGLTITPGVYTVLAGTTNLSGAVTLNGLNDPNAVWVFQMPTTLITSSGSVVNVINAGSSPGVYWNVGSSAILGTNSTFMGNILALTSITMTTGATDLCGRLLADNGAVTLDHNTISGVCSGVLADSGGLDQGNKNIPPPNPVTEPATMLLLGCGLVGLVAARRRFKKA